MNTPPKEFGLEHERLSELLGAYLDDELSPEQGQMMEAHLLACDRCWQELALQREVRARLEGQPIERAPIALRQHIQTRLGHETKGSPPRKHRRHWRMHVPVWAGWAVAASLALIMGLHFGLGRHINSQPIPMVTAALANYHQQLADTLPAGGTLALSRLKRSLPFPVTPITELRSHLIAVWSLRISGEPAAALAYRIDNHVVVQYVVSESVFFRQPRVRQAVAAHGVYTVSAGQDSVVAWPGPDNGSLLVGPVSVNRLEALHPQGKML